MTILVPFLVCIIGLLIWAIASRRQPAQPQRPPNDMVADAGRILYAAGLLVTTWVCAMYPVTVMSPMMSSTVAFFVAGGGLLVWALASNSVAREAGRIAFACGSLVCIVEVATHHAHF